MATYAELMSKAKELAAAGDMESAKRLATIAMGMNKTSEQPTRPVEGPPVAPTPETNFLEQTGSGLNEGMAGGFGAPVDMVANAVNTLTGKPNFSGTSLEMGPDGIPKMVGGQLEYPEPLVQNPVGGSDTMSKALDPFISDVAPQNMAQRYGRRVAKEVGYGVPAAVALAAGGPLAASAQSNFPAYMGANVASDVGAGFAGQTSREIAPENDVADVIATFLGGSATAASIGKMNKTRPDAPTRAQNQAETDRLYGNVKNSGATLTDGGTGFQGALEARFAAEGGDPMAFPKANSQINKVAKNPRTSVYDVEQARRTLGKHVARSADESSMGSSLVKETDDYLRSLKPGDIANANPDEVIGDLLAARRSAHTGIKADEITDALNKAKTRTSTTGTAGNSLNAQSQEIRKLYDKEISLRNGQKSGGFSPDEVKAMEKIVFPSRTERNLQRVGRFAPSTGALQSQAGLLTGGGGVSASIATGNPLFALGVVPPIAGSVSQKIAESMKTKNIDQLMDVILRGGKDVPKRTPEALKAAIISQLLNSNQQ